MSAARLLLTGAGGQLGSALQAPLSALGALTAAGRQECDLTDEAALARLVRRLRPAVIVNAAAWTDVDAAESQAAAAAAVNARGPALLAALARETGALLLHYCTDYVYDGSLRRPYREDDAAAPLSAYGAGKLAGSRAVAGSGCAHAVLRTGWVYGPHGRNFVRAIIEAARRRPSLDVVDDQVGTPTPAQWLAQASAAVAAHYLRAPGEFPSGLYHAAGTGEVSRHAWAQAIVAEARAQGARLAASPADVRAVATADMPRPARRPAYCALDTGLAARALGLTAPAWDSDIAGVVTACLAA